MSQIKLRSGPATLLGMAAVAAFALAASPAQASVTLYTSRAALEAATTGLTSTSFNGYASVPPGYKGYKTGLTAGGVNFTDTTGGLYVIDPSAGFGNPFGGEQFLEDSNYFDTLTVAPTTGPAPTAFGADFTNYDSQQGGTLVATINGTAYDFTVPAGTGTSEGSQFFGFTSTDAITSLSFMGTNPGGSQGVPGTDLTTPGLDNFGFATANASPAPEPSQVGILALMGLSLGGLMLRARKAKAALA